MNAISRKSELKAGFSAAALVLQLDALDQQHRAMDEMPPDDMGKSETCEFDRIGTQCSVLADLLATCHPETPADALCVIMAALGQIDEVSTNGRDVARVLRIISAARDAIIRSLVVLANEHDLSMQAIGARYFFKPGEPGYGA